MGSGPFLDGPVVLHVFLKDKSGVDKIVAKKQPYQLLNTIREFFPSFDVSNFYSRQCNLLNDQQLQQPRTCPLREMACNNPGSHIAGGWGCQYLEITTVPRWASKKFPLLRIHSTKRSSQI